MLSSLAYSQVGVNTPNPQGAFHIDGAKDNPATGAPDAAQQSNDFTVTPTGRVGIGNVAPTSNLHITNNGVATGIGGGEATNTGLLIENPTANSSILSILRTTGVTGIKQAVMGINPNFNGNNGVFIISRTPGGSDFSMDLTTGNMGVGTSTPSAKLDVIGNVKITDGTQGANKVLTSDANGVASWQAPAGIVPTSNGSIIAVNGQLMVAQEITAQLSADFTAPSSAALPIGNLNVEIIDNENAYIGDTTTNSFTVSANGVYQVILNVQLSKTGSGNPVIGIWDDTLSNWIARVNDRVQPPTETDTVLQTFTLITSVNIDSTHTYSFRIAGNGGASVIKALSAGGTGSGPVSQVTIKRLK